MKQPVITDINDLLSTIFIGRPITNVGINTIINNIILLFGWKYSNKTHKIICKITRGIMNNSIFLDNCFTPKIIVKNTYIDKIGKIISII